MPITSMIEPDTVRPLPSWARPPITDQEIRERQTEIAALRVVVDSPRVSQFARNYCAADADALAAALARELERGRS